MADASGVKLNAAVGGLGQLSIFRQIGVLVGLAASIALAGVVIMWSQEPGYQMIYSGLADQDSLEITKALDQAGIPHKMSGSGTIMVPGNQVHDARLRLAGQGLPKGNATGFELLDKEQGLGVSQFMENARYQRALEGELAKTIGSISGVQSARVHLAIPKQTSFIRDRDRKMPSASVMLTLYAGRQLESGQVASIVNLVGSSVPGLSPDRVTVVDQAGRLLSSPGSANDLRLTATQFEYRKQLEDYYIKRIEEILTPILGHDGVRAQVSADMDFSVIEQTQESYNPDMPAIRSEQTSEDQSRGPGIDGGVPGALTNQPPITGANAGARKAAPAAPAAGSQESSGPQSSAKRTTRNYELDKTISHTQFPTGTVKRLSIAVVIDDKQQTDAEGNVQRTPRTEEEITRITALAKDAIGFNTQRGDSLNVINASFTDPPKTEPAPEPGLLEKPWLWDVGKQVLAGLAVLVLIFAVLRPLLKNLVEKAPPPMMPQMISAEVNGGEQGRLTGGQGQQLGQTGFYEQQVSAAQNMAAQDPKRVAQVVKNWVSSDG